MEMLRIRNVGKSFTLHVQDSAEIPVFRGVDLTIDAGECIAITGASGAGKSTFMRMVYANYRCPEGEIFIRHAENWVDMACAPAHAILDIRRQTLGYVSQFLRVIPRTPTLDIVAAPLRDRGVGADSARDRAAELLARLNIPEELWSLSPMTFSGGEQQRVNIARGFVANYPLLLLDEPTASLDAANRQVVLDLIREATENGCAVLGIFHDQAAREAVCSGEFDITPFKVNSDA